jgi:hypothetical protein
MDKKSSLPPLDVALENLDPTRRRFLGLMLAGAATLPALTTTAFAAQDADKNVKQTIKPSASSDKNSTVKDGVQSAAPGGPRKATLEPNAKSSDSNTAKNSDSKTVKSSDTIKSSDSKTVKSSDTIKSSDSKTVKGSDSQTVKSPDSTVKSSSPQTQSSPSDKEKPTISPRPTTK